MEKPGDWGPPRQVAVQPTFVQQPRYVKFAGEIIDITHHTQVAPAIAKLREDALWAEAPPGAPTHYVGFDMEWRPEYVPGQSNPVALIQLATDTICLLFYMSKLSNKLPKELESLFLDPTVLKIGLSVTNDLRKLHAQFRLVPKGLLDVSEMARNLGYQKVGLKGLALDVLNWHIAKGQARSNWAKGFLSPAQRLYAATDAYVTLQIYLALEEIEETKGLPPYRVIGVDNEEVTARALGKTDSEMEEIVQALQRDFEEANSLLQRRLDALEAANSKTIMTLEQRIARLERENLQMKEELARLRPSPPSPPQQTREHIAIEGRPVPPTARPVEHIGIAIEGRPLPPAAHPVEHIGIAIEGRPAPSPAYPVEHVGIAIEGRPVPSSSTAKPAKKFRGGGRARNGGRNNRGGSEGGEKHYRKRED